MSEDCRTFKLTVAYDGTDYAGWQYQPNALSIQEAMEAAVRQVTGETVRLVASGRTDSGVHALGQVVSCRLKTQLPVSELHRALNATTPRDICIRTLEPAAASFHAIRDASGKRYRYWIQDGRFPDPLRRRNAWFVPAELNVEAMDEAARSLLGEHDFKSFEASGSERSHSIRIIQDILCRREPDAAFPRIKFEVAANGFLYNMVRNIVGSLVDIGKGVRPVDWFVDLLRTGDRRQAGMTAPPQGLVLVEVYYDA